MEEHIKEIIITNLQETPKIKFICDDPVLEYHLNNAKPESFLFLADYGDKQFNVTIGDDDLIAESIINFFLNIQSPSMLANILKKFLEVIEHMIDIDVDRLISNSN